MIHIDEALAAVPMLPPKRILQAGRGGRVVDEFDTVRNTTDHDWGSKKESDKRYPQLCPVDFYAEGQHLSEPMATPDQCTSSTEACQRMRTEAMDTRPKVHGVLA